ncbi:MAG: hypothetical protein ACYC9L_08655 [Sulfuricaulis sp.]
MSKEILDESGKLCRRRVMEIVPATPFYKAEKYCQRYLLSGTKTAGKKLGEALCTVQAACSLADRGGFGFSSTPNMR